VCIAEWRIITMHTKRLPTTPVINMPPKIIVIWKRFKQTE